MPKVSSIGVSRYSSASTASALKPLRTSTTSRSPRVRSVRSFRSAMPFSFLAWTRSLIRAMTFSGPTPYGSSVTTIPVRRGVSCSTTAVARVRKMPRPVSYASRTPSRPTIRPPVGRSGPGTNRISASSDADGLRSRCRAAAITSPRLCGAMLVAIPTAMPDAPFTSRFGRPAGSTLGWVSLPS